MGQLKYLNGSSNLDMSQNTVMLKVKEQLKERLDKKLFENSKNNQLKKFIYKKVYFYLYHLKKKSISSIEKKIHY